ncbi:cell division protein ZapA [Fulvivirga sedimenti]|uniref:Cell division protein ZapA n=1 Tax=Fulvivirga sedimenti TaxID=2879465 RepID=A0A9X1HV53_9BACT|nr:cell division protein ZapA [Fulvivirga sedimenti]MCA6077935.1 cell division protein ZapA [Fulvivirga sedimenti]
MDELSIKIKIADREYPMKVRPEDEERVRKAGKSINERLRNYRERFGIDDKQDLLSMVAFDCLIEKMEAEEKSYGADESVLEKINDLNNRISQAL